MLDKYQGLRNYYKGYGVYNRQGKLVNISTMTNKQLDDFQNALALERKNYLKGRIGWKVIIRKLKK